MAKYLLKRLLHGAFSVIIVTAIIMILIYTLLSRDAIFQHDDTFNKQVENDREVYKYDRWEKYGYLDYINYSEYINELVSTGKITDAEREQVALGYKPSSDSDLAKKYIKEFTDRYESKGYTVKRLLAITTSSTSTRLKAGGSPKLFAYKDVNLFARLWGFFSKLIRIDNIHYAEEVVGNRGITFTWFDPSKGGDVFSPAILGNGTKYKYLLYFDGKFPFIHQNLITFSLGTSYSISQGNDIAKTMSSSQGSIDVTDVYYPTGLVTKSADDLHSLTYIKGSNSSEFNKARYVDDYTYCDSTKTGMSMIGYSFVIGIIATILSYLLGVPLGILMARKKDKLADKIGTVYIVFIMAVPSLAYIFMFKALGGALFGLPTTFDMDAHNAFVYILPIISLALPSVASLMRWLRRYMIDQMNSDYVKFARSGGLSDSEIFRKHILKNAAIPIIHGIPGSILGCIVGAIITESVYVVPGTGKLLTDAIKLYDNSVIVGLSFFYAILSVVSLILGDILMALIDPRISFSTKGR